MPHFNKSIKTVKFHGIPIPQSASLGAKGSNHGVYFFWNGEWMFTAIRGFYIPVPNCNIDDHRGNNPIEKLK